MNQWKGYSPDNVLGAERGAPAEGLTSGPGSGALTYEPYYGLRSKPFSVSTDPRTLYKSPSHAAVLEDVLSAIRRREGLIVLTGEMGTGKTTLCRAALYQLDRKTFTTFVPDPFLSREDLLRMLLVGFGEVSVDDLKQGRLKGTPRADLGCQLYEFLTSLESVDAFAVLVIDEAQHLAGPILDEIRALSELEAGRRLLQIVLVGQPELRSRLALPEMQQIAQRVTTMCELRPLSREGVGGYVTHRIAVAGGARDRVEFSQAALDLAHEASGGIPRLLNRICDRALFHGHHDHASHIGHAQVARALHDLELTRPSSPTVAPDVPATPTEPPAVPEHVNRGAEITMPGGLFGRKATVDAPAPLAGNLASLLDLPPVVRQSEAAVAPAPRSTEQTRSTRRTGARQTWWQRVLTSVSLPVLSMLVMLLAGGLAVSTAGARGGRVDLPPIPAPPLPAPTAWLPELPQGAPGASASLAAAAVPSPQTWVVQVAALSRPARASALVERLAGAGLPAYQVETDLGPRGRLTIVRLGPYESAGEADAIREHLLPTPEFEGAFVRNITSRP